MKLFTSFLFVVSLTLGYAQLFCDTQEEALDTCLESAGLISAQDFLCVACLGVGIVDTRSTSCGELTAAICPVIDECACGPSCGTEILDYVTCETNLIRRVLNTTCEAVECEFTPGPPLDTTTEAPAAAPSDGDGSDGNGSIDCFREDLALGTCLSGDGGLNSAEEFLCEACIGRQVLATRSTACGDLAATACPAIVGCPCSDACESEMIAYFSCESNDVRERSARCGMLSCSADGSPPAPDSPSSSPPASSPEDTSSATLMVVSTVVVATTGAAVAYWSQI